LNLNEHIETELATFAIPSFPEHGTRPTNGAYRKPLSYAICHSDREVIPDTGCHGAEEPDVEDSLSRTLLGNDPAMKLIRAQVKQVAPAQAPVLILGETGCGKEVLARLIHEHSTRSNHLFLKLNCAALPSELVESELFGYERGAFTGAFQRKAGMFELAHKGTIFLDEIGDMELHLQAKLLQVLQDGEFHRLGGREMVRSDVRIVAATHRNLETAIETNSFRQDLYYRLNVLSFELPPLRDRRGDILLLAQRLIQKHLQVGMDPPPFTPALREALIAHDWPGNVRELENVMRRLLAFGTPEHIIRELNAKSTPRISVPVEASPSPVQEIPVAPIATASASTPQNGSVLQRVAEAKNSAEAEVILATLDSVCWNRKKAAQILSVDYKALLYKMKKLSIGERKMAAGC